LFGYGSYDEFSILEKMVEWSRSYQTSEFRPEKKKDPLEALEEKWLNSCARRSSARLRQTGGLTVTSAIKKN
jgi:hypothetical protein